MRIALGASVGIPAASLCINRRLYQIARAKPDTISAAQVSTVASTFQYPSN
jgi:pheromone a factor receptor